MLTARDLSDGKEPVSYEELDFLKELVATLPPFPVIVNIGAADGLSTMAFLEERVDCFIYSIDVDPCPQELEHVEQGGHDVRKVVRLLGNSQKIGANFPHDCDMLFVDGDHWGAGKDAEIWASKVKPGGIIAFHDFIVPPNPLNNPGSVYDDVMAWHRKNDEYDEIGWVDRVIAFGVPGG